MRGKEAVKKCPELQLVQVPLTHGKAELGPYRAAGKQVPDPVERISISAVLDTPSVLVNAPSL